MALHFSYDTLCNKLGHDRHPCSSLREIVGRPNTLTSTIPRSLNPQILYMGESLDSCILPKSIHLPHHLFLNSPAPPIFIFLYPLNFYHLLFIVLGFEVNKSSKISIKTSSATECIEFDIQNIEAPRTYDPIISYVFIWFL